MPQQIWRFLSARGRITRSRYWFGFGLCFLIAELSSQYSWIGHGLLGLFGIILVGIIGLPVFVLRLHDLGCRGWWLLLLFLNWVVFIGLLSLGLNTGPSASGQMEWAGRGILLGVTLLLILLPLNLWMMVQLGFLRGERVPNRYGADPLAPKD